MLIMFNTLPEAEWKITHASIARSAIYCEVFAQLQLKKLSVSAEIDIEKSCSCDGNLEINDSFFE